MSGFRGFPKDALAFFVELEANNNRPWWLENKERFEASVRDPMRALLDELEPTYGTFHAFRMNRDVRFSKDKSPYKTAHAAMAETEGGSSLYVHLSQTGLFIGAGVYHPARDQLARYREAVLDDGTGKDLERAVDSVRKAGIDVGPGEGSLATAPRGVPKDHARIELLRWKGCIASRDVGAPAWIHTARAVKEVRNVWDQAAPLIEWLDAHVGATEESIR